MKKLFLTLAVLVTISSLETVLADVDGTPPTFSCSVTVEPTAGNEIDTDVNRGSISANGYFFYPYQNSIGTGAETGDSSAHVVRVSPTCGTFTYEVCDNTDCPAVGGGVDQDEEVLAMSIDPAGRLVIAFIYQTGGGTDSFIETRDFATGNLINRSANLDATMLNIHNVKGIRNGTTDIDYLAVSGTGDRIVRMNRNLTMTKWSTSIALGNSAEISVGPDETFVTVGGVSSGSSTGVNYKILTATGAQSGSTLTGGFNCCSTVNDGAFEPGYSDTTTGYKTTAENSGLTEYEKVTLSTFGSITTTALGFDQIFETAAFRATTTEHSHLDGADNLVGCGYFDPSGTEQRRAFTAYYDTISNEMEWNLTFDQGMRSVTEQCAVDPMGALWVAMGWNGGSVSADTNALDIQRYIGGDMEATEYPRVPTVTLGTETAEGNGNVIDAAKDFAEDSWGFDWDWIIFMAIVGIVTIGFSKASDKDPFVSALGGLLGAGIGVAVTEVGIWILLVIIFLVIAIAGSRLFGGRNGDEGE